MREGVGGGGVLPMRLHREGPSLRAGGGKEPVVTGVRERQSSSARARVASCAGRQTLEPRHLAVNTGPSDN